MSAKAIVSYRGHSLVLEGKSFYDLKNARKHYIGKMQSKADAFNRWKNYLYSIGIEPSGAKQVRK